MIDVVFSLFVVLIAQGISWFQKRTIEEMLSLIDRNSNFVLHKPTNSLDDNPRLLRIACNV